MITIFYSTAAGRVSLRIKETGFCNEIAVRKKRKNYFHNDAPESATEGEK